MKNVESWSASKFVFRNGRLRPTSDRRELAASSVLIARLVADKYETALPTHTRGMLLDLGSGKVPFYGSYRRYASAVICVDWPGSLHGSLHLDAFCDLSKALPFTDESFDTVLSSDVIEHLPDPALAFREIGRILRPGGKLLLNTPFLYMLHEIPNDFCRHTRFSIRRLVQDGGLEILRLEEVGGVGEVLADILAKAVSTIPLIGSPIAVFLQQLVTTLGRTRLWQRGRRTSAPSFPLGYFLVAEKPDASRRVATS